MTVSRALLLCWALLVALSIGTVLTGAAGLWLVVLLLAVAKGWVIADGCMELRHAPRLWRAAMLGWTVVIVGVIAIL